MVAKCGAMDLYENIYWGLNSISESYQKAYGLRCVWSPNGQRLAISHNTGNVYIYDRVEDHRELVLNDVVVGNYSNFYENLKS